MTAPLRLNLAALTEGELLTLFGPAETGARLPEITRARLEGRPLLGYEIPAQLPAEPLSAEGRLWGATPEQSRALAARHAELLAEQAEPGGVYVIAAQAGLYTRAYTLGETAIGVQWAESGGTGGAAPTLRLLTWLRDRGSGLACVQTTSAAQHPAPTVSEEIDLHLHPGLAVAELLKVHRQQVHKLGRPQKLAPEAGWYAAWQAAHDLNLAAWKRRGVVLGEAAR